MNFYELIIGCKKEQPLAQKALFCHLAPKMIAIGKRYVRDSTDAEELMLNAFTKFFQQLASFEFQSEGQSMAYIKKIMVNECLMFLRKKKSIVIHAELEDEIAMVDDSVFAKMSSALIYQAIQQLPDGYRLVFNLSVLEGYTHKEIAECLQISEGTSKSQLFHAKKILQKILTENEAFRRKEL